MYLISNPIFITDPNTTLKECNLNDVCVLISYLFGGECNTWQNPIACLQKFCIHNDDVGYLTIETAMYSPQPLKDFINIVCKEYQQQLMISAEIKKHDFVDWRDSSPEIIFMEVST